ncbi:uncharacterized protein LOC6566511 [Drosophila grimshawi]|uniref:uncharacterized protein LOC6566511 n=1 Tax=Drosophila grimshawi TaxID=7222 RepID=UPI000C8707B2|nr:uncharacterized protein LOC6566511 [Drosophila grimshawi]
MLHHANLRGSPQQFGQGRRIQVDNAAKLANYYEQLNERRDWLFSLGLIGRRAHDLAVQTLELPEFNLDHFQQRVNRLSLQLGSSRLAAVDAIIVDEIRELMKHQRTPSSPRVTNFNLSCRNTSDYDQRTVDFQTDDIYTDHRMYSAPVRALELRRQTYDAHRGSPQVYNIEDDPRNFDDAPRVEQKTQFVPYWNNNNYNNVDHCCEHNFEDAYNIEADSRNIENNFPKPQVHNFIDYSRNNQHKHSSQNNENYADPNKHYRQRPSFNHATNFNRMKIQRKLPEVGNFQMNFNEQFKNDFRGRKRAAQPNYKPNNHSGPKRRKMNEPNQIFRIRDFEMPYIKNDTKPLPQPEHKSYAIKFFQRKHNYIVGGEKAACSVLPVANPINQPPNYSFLAAKRFRKHIREDWSSIYRSMSYRKWGIWWKDFKWCEAGIDKELEQFKGINLSNISFLNLKVDFDTSLAQLYLKMKSTNYYFTMCAIFDIMNVRFLEKLDMKDTAKLEHIIRNVPNHLWTYKMRGMVYLWSRYSKIRTNSIDSNKFFATQMQWSSPTFHWLAKQAYEELKTISQIEWPEHNETYALL